MFIRTGIGQACRRFLPAETSKPCRIGGVTFEDEPGLHAESDGDVVFHAICNAISSVTGRQVLFEIAEDLLKNRGITDSEAYLREAVAVLGGQRVTHVAITLKAMRPHFMEHFEEMVCRISEVMGLRRDQVGITAISGEGLSEGIHCMAVVTTEEGG